MRTLTLDEKISIKGKLATKGVNALVLAKLDIYQAMHLFWKCFGIPVAMHSDLKKFRKSLDMRRKYA